MLLLGSHEGLRRKLSDAETELATARRQVCIHRRRVPRNRVRMHSVSGTDSGVCQSDLLQIYAGLKLVLCSCQLCTMLRLC